MTIPVRRPKRIRLKTWLDKARGVQVLSKTPNNIVAKQDLDNIFSTLKLNTSQRIFAKIAENWIEVSLKVNISEIWKTMTVYVQQENEWETLN